MAESKSVTPTTVLLELYAVACRSSQNNQGAQLQCLFQYIEDHPHLQQTRLILHTSRGSCAIKVGSYTRFSVKVPLFQGISMPHDPSFYGIFGGRFCFLIWGVGVVKSVFRYYFSFLQLQLPKFMGSVVICRCSFQTLEVLMLMQLQFGSFSDWLI